VRKRLFNRHNNVLGVWEGTVAYGAEFARYGPPRSDAA
jgi:hypothetical protein